jgi:hypothetical protein
LLKRSARPKLISCTSNCRSRLSNPFQLTLPKPRLIKLPHPGHQHLAQLLGQQSASRHRRQHPARQVALSAVHVCAIELQGGVLVREDRSGDAHVFLRVEAPGIFDSATACHVDGRVATREPGQIFLRTGSQSYVTTNWRAEAWNNLTKSLGRQPKP